jgi:uncharacterized protein YqhQ
VSRIEVGGQAVIEGVMMRSPSCFVVACRKRDGRIVVREDRWRSAWERVRFLRWPLLRGGVVLWETLHNGLSALTFSANLQAEEEADLAPDAPRPKELGSGAITRMMLSAVVLALLLFVALPHVITAFFGFKPAAAAFHVVDGLVKLAILVGYIGGVSLLPEMRRVYQYHGAEHKAIFTHEAGEPLTVENARGHSRFHPRCGTSFLLIVVLVSMVVFALTLKRPLAARVPLDHALKILIKLPLMLPIAGISYELIKLAGRRAQRPVWRLVSLPGLWLQRLTTREPTDEQLEVALAAVGRTLRREQTGPGAHDGPGRVLEVLDGFEETSLPLAAASSEGG